VAAARCSTRVFGGRSGVAGGAGGTLAAAGQAGGCEVDSSSSSSSARGRAGRNIHTQRPGGSHVEQQHALQLSLVAAAVQMVLPGGGVLESIAMPGVGGCGGKTMRPAGWPLFWPLPDVTNQEGRLTGAVWCPQCVVCVLWHGCCTYGNNHSR
jgi:hypothetical protein